MHCRCPSIRDGSVGSCLRTLRALDPGVRRDDAVDQGRVEPLTDTSPFRQPIPPPPQSANSRKLIHPPLGWAHTALHHPRPGGASMTDDGGGNGRRGKIVLPVGSRRRAAGDSANPDRPSRNPVSARLLCLTAGKAARQTVLLSGASGWLAVASLLQVSGPQHLADSAPSVSGGFANRAAQPVPSLALDMEI